MLTWEPSKINLDWSTAISPIDSESLNQSVVTSPIDLEYLNLSKEKGYQNGSQSDLFDSEKGSENDKNNKLPKKWRRTSKQQKYHNNADKSRHQRKEDKSFLVTTHLVWVAYDRMRKGCKRRYANEIVQKMNNMHGTNVNYWTVAKYVSVDIQ